LKICCALVENGVVPWQDDVDGKAPFFHALSGGHVEIVSHFLSLDTIRSGLDKCLCEAVQENHVAGVQALVEAGAKSIHVIWLSANVEKLYGRRQSGLSADD
jgi:hypothetical protein